MIKTDYDRTCERVHADMSRPHGALSEEEAAAKFGLDLEELRQAFRRGEELKDEDG